jgi:TonB family protein
MATASKKSHRGQEGLLRADKTRTILIAWLLLAPSFIAADDSPWHEDVRSARRAIEKGDLALAESFLGLALRSARNEDAVDGRLPSVYETLAGECWRRELPDDAIQASKMAIALWKEVGGANQARIASSMSRLAQAHEGSGRLEEAETLFVEAVRVLEARYGADGATVAGAEERLAKHYEERLLYADAGAHYKRAFRILTEAFGIESPLIVPTVQAYIGVLKNMSQHSEAVELEALLRQTDSAVHKIGHGVKLPSRTAKKEPEYSEEARAKHVEGTVAMTVALDENGVPTAIWVKEPAGFGLDNRAVEAVSTWRFNPAERDGQPVAAVVMIEMNLRLL